MSIRFTELLSCMISFKLNTRSESVHVDMAVIIELIFEFSFQYFMKFGLKVAKGIFHCQQLLIVGKIMNPLGRVWNAEN